MLRLLSSILESRSVLKMCGYTLSLIIFYLNIIDFKIDNMNYLGFSRIKKIIDHAYLTLNIITDKTIEWLYLTTV